MPISKDGSKHSAAKVGTSICAALQAAGMSQKTAASYAQLAVDVINRIQEHPELLEGLLFFKQWVDNFNGAKDAYMGSTKAVQIAGYLRNARILGLGSAVNRLEAVEGGATALSLGGFITLIEAAAKVNNIELTEWCLSVSKISIAFATVLAAGVAAPEIASFAALLILIALFKESYTIGSALLSFSRSR
jgi:hypothetical protein